MANVIHPHIDFHHGTVTPNLCFGFGMSNSPAKGWQQPIGPGHNNSAVFQQLASNIAQPSFSNRPQKRRHEPDDYENVSANGRHGLSHATATGLKDEAMERSPTPERPKKGPPKRARLIAVTEQGNKEQRKENKPSGGEDDGDVDVGVLLGEFFPNVLCNFIFLRSFISSELTTSITLATTDFITQRTTIAQINNHFSNTPAYSTNSSRGPCTVRQEITRCLPLFQRSYTVPITLAFASKFHTWFRVWLRQHSAAYECVWKFSARLWTAFPAYIRSQSIRPDLEQWWDASFIYSFTPTSAHRRVCVHLHVLPAVLFLRPRNCIFFAFHKFYTA